ncbi:hypothetical protein GGTG_00636 [Gaeumannomyces tritici R3-111a-1]|uniref:Uncharacterized protein n=1 Tax=Gaeumannomyces tritici (strain R3-111a-1) TaxID=644352 RepID=J3NH99_GAET3|nr:hypothetical protein GGTG_00636 [Gaeumannomyces tritici R3-111a-1]EJT80642.1 hypothetical protein GGTG_00636 [Gaeumannomyces tritici R3-111a-1]
MPTDRAQVTDLNGEAEGYPEDLYDEFLLDEPKAPAPPQLRFGLGENLESGWWTEQDANAAHCHDDDDDDNGDGLDAAERKQLALQLRAEAWEDRRLVPRLRDYVCSPAFLDAFKQAEAKVKQQAKSKADAAEKTKKEKATARKAERDAAKQAATAAMTKGQWF